MIIPYSHQEISESDIRAVEKVLRSDFLTQGQAVTKFEKMVAKKCNAAHAIAVNSATSALHIACLVLGLKLDDRLWTSPNTFVASANCALYCGAKIDFVDIDPKTYNMSIEALTEKLVKAEKKGKLPKIVVPVHFAGQPSNMSEIYKLSKIYGFKIIEDASHAIGSSFKNHKIGSCKYSDITIFSFHPVKIITTGEGGMALTNQEELADRMRRLSSHGITRDKDIIKKVPKDEIWNYQQVDLGYNYRLTDIQAALGISQISRIDDFVFRRNEIARLYNTKLMNIPVQLPWQSPSIYSSYHLYPIRIKKYKNINQKLIYNLLWNNKIAANIHYIPVHRQPYFEKLGFKKGDFPEAEKFHKEVISLPLFPSLKKDQQDLVIQTLLRAYNS